MPHTFWHDETLFRRKLDDAIFEIDQKTPVDHVEKLIDFFVLVPVIFTLNHGQPNDRIIYIAERLVPPPIGAGIGQLLHIDEFERSVQNVEMSLVREIFDKFFRIHGLSLTAESTEVAKKIQL